jgi:hypothetical protein
MKKIVRILFISAGLSYFVANAAGQTAGFHFPQREINQFNEQQLQRITSGESIDVPSANQTSGPSGVGQLLQYKASLVLPSKYATLKGKSMKVNDTLFIVDTMTVTGNWSQNGPIIIVNHGLLHFQNANATILGNIFLMGTHPMLMADSSVLYIPQQYFYQRSLVITGGGRVHYHNTIVDHSGLSHNLVVTDSALLELKNVTNIGFTTNGVYGKAAIKVNGINQAGEYIMEDFGHLDFKNATTVLLWHQFPAASSINFSFPANGTVYNYHFNNTLPGVSGINYLVSADSCYDVMWGMMPVTGSDVTISNSVIRSIGLWFLGSDTVAVNGLVNNSTYTSFTAPLSDRHLQLNNCSVQTWSLYPMDQTVVNMTGCIVGEIGTMNTSRLNGTGFLCDGSGGYLWAADNTFVLAGNASASGYVRSQVSGILLLAYSSEVNGYPSSLNNSIIMVIQSTVPQEPVPLDNSAAWFAYLDQPFDTYTDMDVAVTGSAWIHKTPSSLLMDFHSYRLYYQKNGTSTWTEIPTDSLNEKSHENLAIWHTYGLSPGQYVLKLTLRDSWGNTADAMKGVNMMTGYVALEETGNEDFKWELYPDPATDMLFMNLSGHDCLISIYNVTGKILMEKKGDEIFKNGLVSLDVSKLKDGMYFLNLDFNNQHLRKKFVKLR